MDYNHLVKIGMSLAETGYQLRRCVNCTPVLLRSALVRLNKGSRHPLHTDSDVHYSLVLHRVLHIDHRRLPPDTRSSGPRYSEWG